MQGDKDLQDLVEIFGDIEESEGEENAAPNEPMPDIIVVSEGAKTVQKTPRARRAICNEATGATKKPVRTTTPKSNRSAVINAPEMVMAPKRANRVAIAESPPKKRWTDGPQAYNNAVAMENEAVRCQRIAYADGSGAGPSRASVQRAGNWYVANRDGSGAGPSRGIATRIGQKHSSFSQRRPLSDEAAQRMVEVQNERARRIVETVPVLLNAGAPLDEDDELGFDDTAYLFSFERSLRFFMCQDCVDFYFADTEKVCALGGGSKMLTLVLCPSCVVGNNGLRRYTRDNFPTGFQLSRNMQ